MKELAHASPARTRKKQGSESETVKTSASLSAKDVLPYHWIS
jgi:hypothetical protein